MAKLPENFNNPFYKANPRESKITLTISPRYISFSTGAYLAMNYAHDIYIATEKNVKNTVFIFKADENDKGTFHVWNTKQDKPAKIVRPAIAKQVAELLGLDNSKTTWRIPGIYDEKNDCLIFDGKKAIKLKQKPLK